MLVVPLLQVVRKLCGQGSLDTTLVLDLCYGQLARLRSFQSDLQLLAGPDEEREANQVRRAHGFTRERGRTSPSRPAGAHRKIFGQSERYWLHASRQRHDSGRLVRERAPLGRGALT